MNHIEKDAADLNPNLSWMDATAESTVILSQGIVRAMLDHMREMAREIRSFDPDDRPKTLKSGF